MPRPIKRRIILSALVIIALIAGLTAILGSRNSADSTDTANTDSNSQTGAEANASPPSAGSPAGSGNNSAATTSQTPQSAGAAGSSAQPTDGSVKKSFAVDITSNGFSPASITVKPGLPVTWTNKDSASHALDPAPGSPSGPHSPQLASGQSFTYTYKEPGTYKYICVLQPGLSGTVIVE